MLRIVINSATDTRQLAHILSRHLVQGDLVILSGDLGTGKTVFTRELLASFGVETVVTSPTFVLVKSYMGRIPIEHVDIYRVDDLEELDILCIGELLEDGHLVIVEWGEKALGLFGDSYLQITFERLDEDVSMEAEMAGEARRYVTLEAVGPKIAKRRHDIELDIAEVWSAAI